MSGDVCSCGHDVTDHGFNFGCIYCDCASFEDVLVLQAELDELERTDPDVAAAAASYDRMVERLTGRNHPAAAVSATRTTENEEGHRG